MRYLILAAIVIAGGIIVVDTIRQRRALRRLVRVPVVVASALERSRTSSGPASPYAVPVSEDAGDLDLWETLADRVDPEAFVPKLAAGTEVKTFRMRWGNDYAIAARPDHRLHFELQPWEAELMQRMDGTQTVGELIVDRLQDEGDLDPGAVIGLVEALRQSGFLDPARPDVRALVRDHLDRSSHGRRKLREFTRNLKIGWDDAERLVAGAYRAGLKVFFLVPVALVGAAVALGGLTCFVVVERSGRYTLSSTAAPAETILFLALALFLTFCHELGHALVLVHNKRRVISAGFFIFFGSPAFFVDASDGLMLERRHRIAQSFAGPFAELMLAGVASIVMIATPGTTLAAFLYRFALINYFLIFMNLIPLLELDGYWIFSDLIQMPNLRRRSLSFIEHDLWHKLRVRERFSLQEGGLAFYGIIGTLFTVFSFYTAYFFWQEIFGGLVSSLWEGGFDLADPARPTGARVHRTVDPRSVHAREDRGEARRGARRADPVPRGTVLARRSGGADRRSAGVRRPRRGRALRPRGPRHGGHAPRRADDLPPRRRRRRVLRDPLGRDPHRRREGRR